jgi:hypothetical protein
MTSQRAGNALAFFLFSMHSAISAKVFSGFVQFLQYNEMVVQYLELDGHLIPKVYR